MTHFAKYFSIGIINTLIHWVVFAIIISITHTPQGYANLMAFLVSVTFSFFNNAKFTFKKKATGCRYIGFMGMMSYLIGCLSDKLNIHPIITLITFSTISLVLGFLFSKFVVFKGIE